MFQEMRRKDRELSIDETEAILDKGEYGILATVGGNGYPYGIPVNYVYQNRKIYFHCATSGHNLENISNNCNVSFCVVTDVQLIPEAFTTKFRSVVIFGKAREVFEQVKKKGLMALLQKYSNQYIKAGEELVEKSWDKVRVIEIEIERITGKGGR